MKNFKILFVLFSLVISSSILAHEGGHYHKGDGVILNTWHFKTGDKIQGNFFFAKDDKLFLEQQEGIVKSININDLTIEDQQLARLKIDKYLEINNTNPNAESIQPIPTNPYKFVPFILLSFLLLFLFIVKEEFVNTYIVNSKIGLSSLSFLFVITILIACSKSEVATTTTVNNNNNTTTSTFIPKTTNTFIDSAYSAFKPAVSTSFDNTYFYVASNGIPNHNMMIGITNWQQQVPITQAYSGTNSWSIPLQPVYATTPLSTKSNFMKGAVAIAVNGIPIFNALNNRGEDSYKIGELDNWGGHCGKGDDYHYHSAPLHLSTLNGLKPIAFALDGFSVYGAKEPDGSSMSSLDTCHGHIITGGVYHYHGTSDYPYVVGAMKGKVTLDPSTPAPENQIIPQAFTKPVRPATNPLNGASITDFVADGTNGYLLTYKIGAKNGYVKYSWDANNKYTFILTDTGGKAVTNTYQR
jgi:hypothetical protein